MRRAGTLGALVDTLGRSARGGGNPTLCWLALRVDLATLEPVN
jgi:hypothetical protein